MRGSVTSTRRTASQQVKIQDAESLKAVNCEVVGGGKVQGGVEAESTLDPASSSHKPIIPIAEYRRIMSDQTSTDEQILRRLEYIESLCRYIIRNEIKEYVSKKSK